MTLHGTNKVCVVDYFHQYLRYLTCKFNTRRSYSLVVYLCNADRNKTDVNTTRCIDDHDEPRCPRNYTGLDLKTRSLLLCACCV